MSRAGFLPLLVRWEEAKHDTKMKLLHNVRLYVLAFSIFLSVGMWWGVRHDTADTSLQIIRLTQLFALTALAYLYVTVLIGPAVYTFKRLPWRGGVYRARRAIGVSAFYFASLHAYLAFFKQLGGFQGLRLLDNTYLIAISLSFTALVILCLMAATSFTMVVQWLTFKRWKLLHRFVYVAALFVLIHALMIGPHFSDLSATLPQVSFVLLVFLLWLEARRFDVYLGSFFPRVARWQPTLTLLIIATIVYVVVIGELWRIWPAQAHMEDSVPEQPHLPAHATWFSLHAIEPLVFLVGSVVAVVLIRRESLKK